MRRFFVILLAICASLGWTACDVLEETPRSDVTTQSHYTIPEGFEDAVIAAYEPLRSYYGSEQGGNLTVYGTDQHRNAGHGGFHYMNQYNTGLNSEAFPMWELWSNFYQAINTCNAAIGRSSDIEGLDEETKNTRLGEVRFLRAHYYFILVEHFGPIHLTTEETTGVETEAQRDSEQAVYEQIVADLEFAINNLPVTQEDFGRATRPAAKHMLSKVLLTRGYKDFGSSDDNSRASNLAIDVIENSPHRLLDDLEAIFAYDNQQNDEVLFSVQYMQDPLFFGPGNGTHMYFRPWYEVYNGGLERIHEPGYGRPWIRFRPTAWALDNYRPLDADARYDEWFQDVWYFNSEDGLPEGAAVGDTAIWVTEQELNGSKVDQIESRLPGVNVISWNMEHTDDNTTTSMYSDENINIFPHITKVDDWQRPSVNHPEGGKNFIVYRLAETYLLAAEALLRDGSPQDAVEYVNAVRRRAAKPGMEDQMEITASELDLDFILDERSRELFAEYKRWLDLKRTGKLLERVRAHNRLAADNIEEHHRLRPIPANQIQRTSNDYAQNPGY
jgi:hypothetical protein